MEELMRDPFDSPVPYLRWAWQHYYELAWLRYVARLRTRPDMLYGTRTFRLHTKCSNIMELKK